MKNYFLILISTAIICGCNSNETGGNFTVTSYLGNSQEDLEISAESMNSIIESIPSPIEIAMMIKQSGHGFNQTLLNPQDNTSFYTTDHAKAMGIGIYSGDLGYINIFEKTFLTVNYLNTIRNLANDINIGQFFDFETIRRLASNNDKMDSLIFMTTSNFNKMDSFLRDQKRSNMSILMVTGTWIEGLFIATQVYSVSRNSQTLEWIGSQKIIIDQLIVGLSAYKKDPYFNNVISELAKLKQIYDGISIKYEYHEPESVEIDGRLVIIDKSSSTVDITSDQVKQIGDVVQEVRSRIILNS